MKYGIIALAGTALIAAAAVPADSAVFTNLSNTGVANAWTYAIGTVSGNTISFSSALAAQTVANPVWFADTPTSSWIAPDASGTGNPGYYLYSTVFTASNVTAGDSIDVNFAGDDTILRVLLNGVTVYSGNPGTNNYSGFASGSFSNGLKNGSNTLQFAVYNQSSSSINPTGFRAEYTSVNAPVPEPATWGMMVMGFALTGALLRRNRRRAMIGSAI